MIILSDCVTRRLLIEDYESECKLKEIADSITRLHPRNNMSNGILSKPRNMEPTRDSDVTNQKQVSEFIINNLLSIHEMDKNKIFKGTWGS